MSKMWVFSNYEICGTFYSITYTGDAYIVKDKDKGK
ncbi:hypothetical protein IGI43_000763 [Enterococcus sp. AZ126]